MNIRSVSRNLILYGCGNAVLRAGNLLLIPLYTYTLSMREYGLLAAITATIQIISIFIELGTRTGFVRFGPEYGEKNLLGSVLGSTFLLNILGAMAITGISLLFLSPLFATVLHTDHPIPYILLSCFAALAQSLFTNMMTYHRVRNEGVKFLSGSLACFIVLIALNVLFVLILKKGPQGVLISQIITYGGMWTFFLLKAVANVGMSVSGELLRKIFKFGFPLIFAMSGDYFSEVTTVYLLSHFGNLEHVAIYSLGFKIAQMSSIALILPFQLAYEPFVYANMGTPWIRKAISKLFTYLMLIFSFVALSIAFISRDFLRLIAPPNYSPASWVILLILPGIAFRGVYYIGESLLNIRNRTLITGSTVTVVTLFSMMLSYVLIPSLGIYGAIIVFNTTSILSALCLMLFGMKTFPIQLEGRRLAVAGLLLSCFLTCVLLLKGVNGYVYHSVIPMVACVAMAFLYFGNFFNEEEKDGLRNMIRKVRIGHPRTKIVEMSGP